ncbi:MAG: hypothetical protein U0270_38005 [Labilithrix sp.]
MVRRLAHDRPAPLVGRHRHAQAAVQAGATADGTSIAERIWDADQLAKDPIGIIHFDVSAP